MDYSLSGSCPWEAPGKNTGVGCHSLLQGIFLIQGLNPGLLHCRQILYHLSHQGRPGAKYYENVKTFSKEKEWEGRGKSTTKKKKRMSIFKCYLFIWLGWICFSTKFLWISVAEYRIFSRGIQDLVFSPGIKPRPPAMGAWSLSLWTTRGVLKGFFFFFPPTTTPSFPIPWLWVTFVENIWHPYLHICAEDRLLFGSIATSSIACSVLLKLIFLSVPLPNAADLLLCPSPARCAPELGEESPRCGMPAWLATRMHQTWPQLPGHSQTKTSVLKLAILVVYENLTCFHVVLEHNLHPHLWP